MAISLCFSWRFFSNFGINNNMPIFDKKLESSLYDLDVDFPVKANF